MSTYRSKQFFKNFSLYKSSSQSRSKPKADYFYSLIMPLAQLIRVQKAIKNVALNSQR